jgi:tryptophanyl-tRNA synthetase
VFGENENRGKNLKMQNDNLKFKNKLKNMRKQTIFSGVQPSGTLHIGNYLGAIKNWVKLQEDYFSLFCIVDHHAITVKQDPAQLRKNIINTAKIYLAAGVDPKENIIFIQSQVPEHTELCWILNTLAKISELERMTQFKDKAQQSRGNVNMGLFDYPVLMAADILLYKTDLVPVGHDQMQHIELARTLANRFNQTFGDTFDVPDGYIDSNGSRIMGLDDPSKKMSKSAESAYNYISLTDGPEIIKKKISKAVTDSGSEIKFNAERPAVYNLLTIYLLLSDLTKEEIEKKFAGKGYGDLKKDLSQIIINFLKPFQERMGKLKDDKVLKILEDGRKKATRLAKKTMEEVRERVGFVG